MHNQSLNFHIRAKISLFIISLNMFLRLKKIRQTILLILLPLPQVSSQVALNPGLTGRVVLVDSD